MHTSKVINKIINKCSNCKYYQPNLTHSTLGLCLIRKEIEGYYYNNHYNYAEITRSKYGLCGIEGKLFKPIKKLTQKQFFIK